MYNSSNAKSNIVKMQKNMLFCDFYNKLLKTHKPDNVIKNIKSIKKSLTSFTSLFWTIYNIIQENNTEYEEYNSEKEFKIKQDFCIKFLEMIKEKKPLLKEHKVKYIDLENALLYNKDIDLDTLKIFAHIYKINVYFIDNIKYYRFDSSIENENEIYMIKKIDNKLEIEKLNKKDNNYLEKIKSIEKNHYLLENTKKLLNSASYYKYDDLKQISEKLCIMLERNGKRKTKNELYEEIMQYLMK